VSDGEYQAAAGIGEGLWKVLLGWEFSFQDRDEYH
jgi:hypothetical protein